MSTSCMPHCQHPCVDLTGNVQLECGGCEPPKLCRPGAIGFGNAASDLSDAMVSLRAELTRPPQSEFSPCLRLPTSGEAGSLEAAGTLWHLPYFGACREAPCVTAHHESSDAQFVPGAPTTWQADESAPEFGDLPGQRSQRLPEFRCTDSASEAEAIRLIHASISNSTPLVLRACALPMPAVERWAEVAHLRAAEHAFSPLLHPPTEDDQNPMAVTQRLSLPPSLRRDLEWASPFGDLLHRFGRNATGERPEGANDAAATDDDDGTGGVADAAAADQLWVSGGGVEGSLHFDTSDTLHAVVAGAKEMRLASPEYSRHLYAASPGVGTPSH